jgi:hypothetical protein
LQAKLEVGTVDDPLEMEADRAAERVMRVEESGPTAAPWTGDRLAETLQRKCEQCAEEDEGRPGEAGEKAAIGPLTAPQDDEDEVPTPIRRSAADRGAPDAEADELRVRLDSRVGAGRPLPDAARVRMESAFGVGFRHVGVHDDEHAADLNRRLHARAFTFGREIFFGRGAFAPETAAGRRLLAHELAHVVQQRGAAAGPVRREPQPPSPPQLGVRFNITVDEPVSGAEFFVRAVMQYTGVGHDEAEQKVKDKKFACHHPVCQTGVTPDLVGKPIAVQIAIGAFTANEKKALAERNAQVAALPAPERDALNEEADRRFWQQTEYSRGRPLGTGRAEEGLRQLWLRTREGVLRDREAVDQLAPSIREFLTASGGRKIRPEEYRTVLRVAKKVESFSADDWALYERRVSASTDDYEKLERSIDTFEAQQEVELGTRNRIRDKEGLYQQVQHFKATEQVMMTPPTTARGAAPSPIVYPQFRARYETEQASVLAALKAAGFNSIAEFDAAIADFVDLFRKRAREIAMLVLRESEKAVRVERRRYEQAAENASLFSALAPTRSALTAVSTAMRAMMPTPAQLKTDSIQSTPQQQAALGRFGEASRQVTVERAKVAETHPILKDPKLGDYALDVASADELGNVLREDADDRLADIDKTRANALASPDFVLQLDRVTAITRQELGVTKDSIYDLAIHDHEQQLAADHLAVGIAVGVLALGLGLLTFGGGTVAVLGAGAGLGLSVYQAGEEIEKYSSAEAAAHTSFDKALAASSDEPSALWVAVSLIAAGLDGAVLTAAVRSATPAAKVLAATRDVAAFEAELAKATELSAALRRSLARNAAAEVQFQAAADEAGKAFVELGSRINSIGSLPTELLSKVTKAAYYAIKKGITDFDVFLRELKVQKFAKHIPFDSLTTEQVAALRNAFKAGGEQLAADLAKPTLSLRVAYKSGAKTLTIDESGRILLDGEQIAANKYAEVYKQLDLTHAYGGHGPRKNVLDVMNETKSNAPSFASGKFSSDEAFLGSYARARAELEAGHFVPAEGGTKIVDIEATPNAGRAFVRSDKVPQGVTPMLPFDTPAGVSELAVTKVRAMFGADRSLTTIYPSGNP